MQPGGSLSAHSRADPQGTLAKKGECRKFLPDPEVSMPVDAERYERMQRFISVWCTMGMPGTQPFFEALWAVMRLQVIPENLGGAGGFRIEWEFDDAVFKEAAGREFMFEAIDVLKGVLAFEEICSSKSSPNIVGTYPDSAVAHSRSALPSDRKPAKISSISSTVQQKRARAPSDPFLDTPTFSRPVASASPLSSAGTTRPLLDGSTPDTLLNYEDSVTSVFKGDDFSGGDEEYLRIWTSPDLTNPELLELLSLFPAFVSRRPLPRFSSANLRHPDIEEGEDEDGEGKRVQFGTGSLWVSSKPRSDGWKGGWWTRFLLWWRRTFC
ncbi:hypothetical protein C0993_011180 [Termitomyces sp. T159_Od127]|nr:hypothetical protein C0993_011180 [Termitomyces sp. T159_Od127]